MPRAAYNWISAPLLMGLCFSAAPAQAGLFDFLFGGGAPRPMAPQMESPTYDEGLPPLQTPAAAPQRRRAAPHPRITVVNKDAKELKIPPGAHAEYLINDHTLRDGDAVMTDKGLRIFAGSSHGTKEFARLADAKGLSPTEQAQLSEVAAPRIEDAEQTGVASEDKVVTGRSSASDTKQAWTWVRDPKGVLVRYVGP